jgi:Na+/H+-translocating membrane pyrophosphatase
MFVVLAVFLPSGVQTAICFVVGALSSALAGWIGMRTATTQPCARRRRRTRPGAGAHRGVLRAAR